jgi:hypothetical protein
MDIVISDFGGGGGGSSIKIVTEEVMKLLQYNEAASNHCQCLWTTLYWVVYLHGSPEKLKIVNLLQISLAS